MPDVRLIEGDSALVLPTIPADSVDAICTDPPAGIAFMGSEWDDFRRSRNEADAGRDNVFGRTSKSGPEYGRRDRQAFVEFLSGIMRECLRVAKPGAYALVWAIPRTSHWTATAIEDSGWRISDRVSHLFSTGFPKHKSKLKPAVEDWWLAWKPDVKATPLNIDGCRIPVAANDRHEYGISGDEKPKIGTVAYGDMKNRMAYQQHQAGRWPAHLAISHDERCIVVGEATVRGDQRGECGGRRQGGFMDVGSETGTSEPNARVYGNEVLPVYACVPGCPVRMLDDQAGHPDCGGASRFFYCPKAPKSDRGSGNNHPTPKNTELMRWLCRLITPAGGTILDPFAGSGSTAVACIKEGFNFIGIEKNPEYLTIARERVKAADDTPPLFAKTA